MTSRFVFLLVSFFIPLSITAAPITLQGLVDSFDTLKSDQAITQITQKSTPKKKTSKPKKKVSKKTISSIIIEGAYYTPKAPLYNTLTLKKGDIVNPIQIQRNAKAIKSLGTYSHVKTDTKSSASGTNVIITVTENPWVGDIQFLGATVFTHDELADAITQKKESLLNINHLRNAIKTIDEKYNKKGYSQAKVFQVASPKIDGDPLIFHIAEGIIEEIRITGNAKTKSYVILREMLTKPGMVMHDNLLREDLRRIFNLGYFQNIEPRFPLGSSPNAYILDLQITEKTSNAQFSFGGGYSPRAKFSMFTDLFWDNLLGTGQLIALKGQFGRATTYQFKYFNPWMWDDRKSFTFKTWLRDGEVMAANPLDTTTGFRDERSKGFEMGVGWPYSYDFRSSHFIKYEDVELPVAGKKYKITSYELGLSYDTRDVRHNPLNGSYHTFSVEKGFNLTKDALEFSKFDLELQHFFKTFEKQTIASRAAFGLIKSPKITDKDLFSREIYTLGGSNTIRGYEEWPPISEGCKSALLTLEYRILFNDIFQGLVFADAGYATYGNLWNFRNFTIGKGIGVRIVVPALGPLRLDYGFDEDGVDRFHLNIGHVF